MDSARTNSESSIQGKKDYAVDTTKLNNLETIAAISNLQLLNLPRSGENPTKPKMPLYQGTSELAMILLSNKKTIGDGKEEGTILTYY